MRFILKYPLLTNRIQTVHMPTGSKIIKVDVQRNVPTIWAMVESDNKLAGRIISMISTGQTLPDGMWENNFIGTFLLNDGAFVLHAFDLGES